MRGYLRFAYKVVTYGSLHTKVADMHTYLHACIPIDSYLTLLSTGEYSSHGIHTVLYRREYGTYARCCAVVSWADRAGWEKLARTRNRSAPCQARLGGCIGSPSPRLSPLVSVRPLAFIVRFAKSYGTHSGSAGLGWILPMSIRHVHHITSHTNGRERSRLGEGLVAAHLFISSMYACMLIARYYEGAELITYSPRNIQATIQYTGV